MSCPVLYSRPCWSLSILYTIVTSPGPLPLYPSPSPLRLGNHKSVFWHSQILSDLCSLRNRSGPTRLAAPNRFISWKVKVFLKGGWLLRCEMLWYRTWYLVPVDLAIFSMLCTGWAWQTPAPGLSRGSRLLADARGPQRPGSGVRG